MEQKQTSSLYLLWQRLFITQRKGNIHWNVRVAYRHHKWRWNSYQRAISIPWHIEQLCCIHKLLKVSTAALAISKARNEEKVFRGMPSFVGIFKVSADWGVAVINPKPSNFHGSKLWWHSRPQRGWEVQEHMSRGVWEDNSKKTYDKIAYQQRRVGG